MPKDILILVKQIGKLYDRIPMLGLAKPPTCHAGQTRANRTEPQAVVAAIAHHEIAANAE